VSWPLWALLVAPVPIGLLAVLVLRSVPVAVAAWWSAAVAAVLGVLVFGLDLGGLGVAVLRGLWTGAWILLIVLPALLLFEVLDRSGALDELADVSDQLAPTEGRRLILLAFVLPSFLQGAAGFGAPIAMSAPLLVRRGMAPAAAVAACLIGYQWSVTFGSMGSSYFMAEATARLSDADAQDFALRAGVLLAVSAVISGVLVLARGARAPGDRWRAVAIGCVMGVVLILVVTVQPALGSTTAGLAGLIACWVLLPRRGSPRPGGAKLLLAVLPYGILTLAAGIGFAVPMVRELFERVPEVAPVLPGVEAGFGFQTAASSATPAFRPLLHPFVYIFLAIVITLVVYRRRGWWPRGRTREAVGAWTVRSRQVSFSIVGLTVLAATLTETGIVAALAEALAAGLGGVFVVFSAPLGALGTVLTGSTTASNALFSSLQAELALAIGVLPAILLSGQTAGGNLGNALSPGVAAVGTAAVGASGQEGAVIRSNLGSAALLLLAVLAGLLVQIWIFF